MKASIKLCLLGLVAVAANAKTASAQQEADYLKYLGAAQKFAQEQKVRGIRQPDSGASAIAVLGLRQRFYQVGDAWSVAFYPSDNAEVRKSASPADLVSVTRKPVYFDFKVTEVDGQRAARIELRQRVGEKERPIEPRVDHMVLVVNPSFVTLKKEIHFSDGRAPAVINTNGQANVSTGFSAYPIDLPTLGSDDGETLQDVPAELKKLSGFDAKHALDFKSNDLYARPVRAVWRDGDLWPVYVKNSAGTAVLEATR